MLFSFIKFHQLSSSVIKGFFANIGWVSTFLTALNNCTQSRVENVISAKIAELQGMMPAIFLFNEGRYRRIYPAYNNKLRREKYWEHVGLASPRDQTDGKFSSRCCRAMKANCVALFVVFNSMSVEDCLTRRHIRVIYPNCQR